MTEDPTAAPGDPTGAPFKNEPVDALLAAAAIDERETGSQPAGDGTDVEDILTTARMIDDFFLRARREQASAYGPGADVFSESMQLFDQFTAVDFVHAYRTGGLYPENRLRELVLRFTDVRLQVWYVGFDGGSVNENYYLPIHLNPDLASSANLTLPSWLSRNQ